MGVPAFYRWLSEKYPKVVQDILEERVHCAPNSTIPLPFDASRPNPSGLECDHLYIDMNGIIHPCSHPENGIQPTCEEEMYDNVCKYIDRLIRVIRPRQLLFLAIDGVAPRAKMNQQRARRFRSAQEARELRELEDHARNEMIKAGHKVPPPKDAWDSNVITPGTSFMINLATYVRFYIRKRLSTDKAWKNLRVIFSDASVPGEGEHKIMAHIRLQRAMPGYQPNLVHVLHGLDADLIMLALATHEAHFYISRELVLFGRKSQEQLDRRQLESGFADEQRAFDEAAGSVAMELEENQGKPLQRVSIPILREYLAAEFADCLDPRRLPFPPSLERLIDDIVFLCFFVGNDFLPHLPSLDIRDGALDFLFNVYKRLLPSLGDYITKSGGQVNLSHVDVILAEVGAIEDYVFQMKHEQETRMAQQREQQKRADKLRPRNGAPPVLQLPQPDHAKRGRAARILEQGDDREVALSRGHQAKEQARQNSKVKHRLEDDNQQAALAVKEMLLTGTHPASVEAVSNEQGVDSTESDAPMVLETERVVDTGSASGTKRPREDAAENGVENDPSESEAVAPRSTAVGVVGDPEDEFDDEAGNSDEDDDEDEDSPKIELHVEPIDPAAAAAFKERVKAKQQKVLDDFAKDVKDNVRLHEAGWKDRYYTDKCKADDVSANGGREHLFRSYVVGLCWVMKYYYDGCSSWKWYFPFHYAPFASDLRNIERFSKDCKALELATPFNPVEQLMAVLPSDSAHALPKPSRWLMSDEESPILDFYPKDVPVDPNGKAMPWLWVVLLPFIDEERLLAALSPTMAKWSAAELLCNSRGLDDGYLYINKSHPLSRKLLPILEGGKTAKAPKVRLTDSAAYGTPGFSGAVRPPLSHEIFPLDDEAPVPPPSSASRIDQSRYDCVFASSIEPNDAICVAFSEPSKLSHKSILLPGARVPAPTLSADDKRIRRPRLNRGGGTIANLGTGNSGQSFLSGYGSMNIGSYERRLAEQTGRAGQLNQPGTRAWGAMEPTAKRVRPAGPPVHLPNPFSSQAPRQGGSGPQWDHRPPHQQQSPPMHQGHHQVRYQQHPNSQFQHPSSQAQHQRSHQQQGYANHPAGGFPPSQPGYQNQHQQTRPPPYSHTGANYAPPAAGYQQYPPQPGYRNPPGGGGSGGGGRGPPAPPQQGYDFRSHANRPPAHGHHGGGPPPQGGGRPGPPLPPPAAQASADVMKNLKAQLSQTLNQNRNHRTG